MINVNDRIIRWCGEQLTAKEFKERYMNNKTLMERLERANRVYEERVRDGSYKPWTPAR